MGYVIPRSFGDNSKIDATKALLLVSNLSEGVVDADISLNL